MDKAGARMGYQLGIRTNTRPYESQAPTNEGSFQAYIPSDPVSGGAPLAVGARVPKPRVSRLAGDAFNLNLEGTTGNPPILPAPYVGGAELRNMDISIPIPVPSF